MMNPRILIASVIAMVIVLASMNWVTNRGVDKVMPMLEKQKQEAAERQKQLDGDIRQDLEGMGASGLVLEAATVPPSPEEMPEMYETSARPLRPLGTWAGTWNGEQTRMAFMKFEKNRYWLLIRNTEAGDYKERGQYEFQFDSMLFKPDDGHPYMMEYIMASNEGISLSKYDSNFNLTKTRDIQLDF